MKIKVLKGFRHDAKYVEPGSVIDVPTPDGRMLVARGRAEEHREPKKAKREYARRDMVAESSPAPTPEPTVEPTPEPTLRTRRRMPSPWSYSTKDMKDEDA